MKVAVSTDSGTVSAHFGRCPQFTIAVISGGKIVETEVVPNPGHHPGYLPQFLHEQGVDCIIAGGMGMRAQQLFAENKIEAVLGVQGSVDDVLKQFAAGKLAGGESMCKPRSGKGYGLDKTACDHGESDGGGHCR